MFTTPIRIGPLIAKNTRAVAIVLALGAYLCVALSAAPADNVLGLLVVILPALEVTMFALIFAIVRDDAVGPRRLGRGLTAFILWSVLGYAAIRLYGAFTLAGIEAYARLEAPPMLDLAF